MDISKEIANLKNVFLKEIKDIKFSKDVEELKIKYFGKKGAIQALMMQLKNVSNKEKPVFGKIINDFKLEILNQIENNFSRLLEKENLEKINQEYIDVTLPGKRKKVGKKHPAILMRDKMLNIFSQMGFSVQLGPDVDNDFYNFEGLNFPKDHPARDMQDSFYITSNLLLRTHTSNVQVRVMENNKPPIRVVAPGRCFRNENISSRSHVFFHQVEAFYIDENVTFSDLLKTLDEFYKKLLGENVKTRFRPSFFPFVEPGLEVDISCTSCKGDGCKICKHTGWLEVAGAGMIHPNVLKAGNIDPEVYSGYAMGLGIERLAMLEYGINDIRMFTENDMRFLKQFA